MGHSELDLVYTAGLFDGEGTVTIGKLKPRPSIYGGLVNPSYMLRFQIAQATDTVLRQLRDMFDIGNISDQPRIVLWQAGGRTAYDIVKLIQPYVRIKRAQVDIGIYFYESSNWKRGGNVQTPRAETLRREAFYHVIRALNSTMGRINKAGELLGHPKQDNQQPSHLNVVELVEWKVQRLIGEDATTNKPDTSARPERDDIVRAS